MYVSARCGVPERRMLGSVGDATCANATKLYTIAVVLLILWLLGLVSSYTLGGFIHVLLVIALVVVLLRVIGGQKPL
jgi:hypothetical protein